MREPARIAVHWAVGLPLSAGLAAAALLPPTPWWLSLTLAIGALGLTGYLLVTSADWLFGPVLLYELVRQARTPRVSALRVGYGLVLLLALFLVYLSYTRGTWQERTLAAVSEGASVEPNERARFAETFFYTFIAIQFGMVLVFAPAMIGGSLASERQRGTLDLLLTTDLSNREVLLGKLGAQLAYLLLLLLAGLPILSILQMLGGVDPNLIFVTFLGTVLSLVTVGSVSMLAAVTVPRMRESLTVAYGFAFGHGYITFTCWLGLMAALREGGFSATVLILVGGYALYAVVVSGIALALTFRWFRPKLTPKERRPPPRRRRPLLRPRRRPRPPRFQRPERSRPPLGDRDAMLWKELYYERGPEDFLATGDEQGQPLRILVILGAVMVVVFVGIGLATTAVSLADLATISNGVIIYLGVPAVQVLLVLMALRGAMAFSREREAQTFDGLLTTSLTDGEILRAKWVACLWTVRFWGLPLGLLYVLALCVGGVAPLAFLLALVALAAHVAFAVNLGLYCSAASASTLRSTVATVVLLVLIACGHWLLALVTQPLALGLAGRDAANIVYEVHLWGLTLPLNLAGLSYSTADAEAPDFAAERVGPALVGVAFYAGLALLLYAGIRRRLRRYREG